MMWFGNEIYYLTRKYKNNNKNKKESLYSQGNKNGMEKYCDIASEIK